jgi:hypothetical protein
MAHVEQFEGGECLPTFPDWISMDWHCQPIDKSHLTPYPRPEYNIPKSRVYNLAATWPRHFFQVRIIRRVNEHDRCV